jgi:phosphonate transport system substrate-binding protein
MDLGGTWLARAASHVIFPPLLAVSLLLPGPGCKRTPPAEKIDLSQREAVAPHAARSSDEAALRIAVGGMITPKEGFAYYRRFLDYIGEKIGRPVVFVDREGYAEVNKLVESADVDVAFVCGGPYVEGHRQFGMELLAAPQAYGVTVYYSYIIVPADSGVTGLDGLRGATFAFTDPMSNSGKLVPTFLLAERGQTPERFFGKVIYSGSHDKSIRAVAERLVDGAAVDSLIWEYARRVDPALTAKTRVIVKSEPYGIPPVVVPKGLNPDLKRRLRQILFDAHLDARGREILAGMAIDRFVPIEDSAYDSIRAIQRRIETAQRP